MILMQKRLFAPVISLLIWSRCRAQESAPIYNTLNSTAANQSTVDHNLNTAALLEFINFLAAQTGSSSSSISRQSISRSTRGINSTAQGSFSVASNLAIATLAKPLISGNAITPPPRTTSTSTASINPTGTAASSDAAVLAGALLRLSKTGQILSADIILPPSRSSFLNSIETIDSELKNLFGAIGGISAGPPSCGVRRPKFRFRRSLLSGLISNLECWLATVKGGLIAEPPDVSVIGPALDEIGSIASTMADDSSSDDDDEDKTQSDDSTNGPSSRGSTSSSSLSSNSATNAIRSYSASATNSIRSYSTSATNTIHSSTSSVSSTSINQTYNPSVIIGFPLSISVPTDAANTLGDVLSVMLVSEFGTDFSALTATAVNVSSNSTAVATAIASPSLFSPSMTTSSLPIQTVALGVAALLANPPSTSTSSSTMATPPTSTSSSTMATPPPSTSSSTMATPSTSTSSSTMTTPPLGCILDFAPWYSPASWCDCSTNKYPLLPPFGTLTSSNCDYTSVPSSTLSLSSIEVAPTNVPGLNGLPDCASVYAGGGQGCAGVDYCDCSSTYVPFLTSTLSGSVSSGCAYATQPTANNCPVNTIAANIAHDIHFLALSELAAITPAPTASTTTPTLEIPTQSAPPVQPTASGVSFPSVEGYNDKGSDLCSSIGADTCRTAYSFYDPEFYYVNYTAYVAESKSSPVNDILGFFASNGCSAMLMCRPGATGLYGKQIIAAFDFLFTKPNVEVCGTIYLENGCWLTVDACNDCEASVPCAALPIEYQPDQGGTYPCYFTNGTTWPPQSIDANSGPI